MFLSNYIYYTPVSYKYTLLHTYTLKHLKHKGEQGGGQRSERHAQLREAVGDTVRLSATNRYIYVVYV